MNPALLDTDILSELLKQQNANVVRHAASYLRHHPQFSFSAFTHYEVTRGLREKQAHAQLLRFATFCQHSTVVPLTDAIFDRAAGLWVLARQGGHPYGDADLLIAATALELNSTLVTGNTRHFGWIPHLTGADWRQP